MNGNERSPVTELQFMACVCRSNCAFHLTAEGLTVCPFSGGFLYELPFCRYKALKSPTLFSIFRWHYEHGNMVVRCISPFSVIFTAKRLWKPPNLIYLAGEVSMGKSGFANRDWLIVTVLRYSMQNTIYVSLVLLIGWWIHGIVCLTGFIC